MQGERMCFKCGSEHARSAPTPSGHHYCPDCGNKWQETPALPSEPEVNALAVAEAIRWLEMPFRESMAEAIKFSGPRIQDEEKYWNDKQEASRKIVLYEAKQSHALRARCAQLEGERVELRAVYEAAEDFVSTPPFDRNKLITLREKVDAIFQRECAEEDAARSAPTTADTNQGEE